MHNARPAMQSLHWIADVHSGTMLMALAALSGWAKLGKTEND
jgi:hypothetical protein